MATTTPSRFAKLKKRLTRELPKPLKTLPINTTSSFPIIGRFGGIGNASFFGKMLDFNVLNRPKSAARVAQFKALIDDRLVRPFTVPMAFVAKPGVYPDSGGRRIPNLRMYDKQHISTAYAETRTRGAKVDVTLVIYYCKDELDYSRLFGTCDRVGKRRDLADHCAIKATQIGLTPSYKVKWPSVALGMNLYINGPRYGHVTPEQQADLLRVEPALRQALETQFWSWNTRPELQVIQRLMRPAHHAGYLYAREMAEPGVAEEFFTAMIHGCPNDPELIAPRKCRELMLQCGAGHGKDRPRSAKFCVNGHGRFIATTLWFWNAYLEGRNSEWLTEPLDRFDWP
jgi:hypothetical protein